MLGSRRLERLLRLRHQHPGQRSGPDRAAALRAQDAGRAGVRPHPAGARPDAVPSTVYYAWLAYRLAQKTGRTDVCALPSGISVPHMFVVTFVVMLPILLSDQRSGPGLGGGPHLGVRAEFRPDGGRLHRARSSARSRRARRCSARWPASRSPSFRCGPAAQVFRRRSSAWSASPSSWRTGSAACAISGACRAAWSPSRSAPSSPGDRTSSVWATAA